mmetsp:Transcript_32542/g.68206  ORF Transcript_32542/g.68206 Transcript_32542/m.68206 type:complete len:206 (-) Transcript_32542:1289-1906(-)
MHDASTLSVIEASNPHFRNLGTFSDSVRLQNMTRTGESNQRRTHEAISKCPCFERISRCEHQLKHETQTGQSGVCQTVEDFEHPHVCKQNLLQVSVCHSVDAHPQRIAGRALTARTLRKNHVTGWCSGASGQLEGEAHGGLDLCLRFAREDVEGEVGFDGSLWLVHHLSDAQVNCDAREHQALVERIPENFMEPREALEQCVARA